MEQLRLLLSRADLVRPRRSSVYPLRRYGREGTHLAEVDGTKALTLAWDSGRRIRDGPAQRAVHPTTSAGLRIRPCLRHSSRTRGTGGTADSGKDALNLDTSTWRETDVTGFWVQQVEPPRAPDLGVEMPNSARM